MRARRRGQPGAGAGRAGPGPRRAGRCPRRSSARRRPGPAGAAPGAGAPPDSRTWPAASSIRGAAPNRSCRSCCGVRIGHMRSRAAAISGLAAQLAAEGVGREGLGRVRRRRPKPASSGGTCSRSARHSRRLDGPPAGVVGARPPLGGRHHLGRQLRREPQQAGAERDLDGSAQRPLAVRDGRGDDTGHAGVPLEALGVLVLPAGGPDAREQAADRGELDAALVEGRQHVLDVAQEGRVRADDQDALALEREAVGVEQIGRPVQGHGGLPGARAALDDQDARAADPG